MSDVNFLNNQKKEEKEGDSKNGGKPNDIKWSEVEKSKGEKKDDTEKGKNNTASSDDISSWLKSLKEDSPVEPKGIKELKKSKEALGEYQKVLRKNKKAIDIKEGVEKIKEAGGVEIKTEGGIASIIKSKLSFGSKKNDDVTIKTNLIKSEGVTYFDWKEKIKVLIINVILTLIILGTGYGYLDYKEKGINQKSSALLAEIETLKGKVGEAEAEVKIVDEFQKKVKIVSDLLDKHIYWTNFFNFLEKNMLSDVYLESNFEGRVDGTFNLISNGDSFTTITNQSRVIRENDKVLNVAVKSGKAKSGDGQKSQEVEFSLNLDVDPSLFYK